MRQNISPELEQSMSNKLLEATKAAGLNFYLNFWKSKFTFAFFHLKFELWVLSLQKCWVWFYLSFKLFLKLMNVWSVKHETSQSYSLNWKFSNLSPFFYLSNKIVWIHEDKPEKNKKWGTGSLQDFWWCLLYLSKTLSWFSLLLSGCSDLRPSESRDWELAQTCKS